MFHYTHNYRIWNGGHIGTEFCALQQMKWMPDRSSKHLAIHPIIGKNGYQIVNDLKTIMSNIVQTTQKWRYKRCSGFGRQQTLVGLKNKGAIGPYAPVWKIFDGFKDYARLFICALNSEGLSTCCLSISDECTVFTIVERVTDYFFCFWPYHFLFSMFRISLVEDKYFVFVVSLDWLSQITDFIALFFIPIVTRLFCRHQPDSQEHLEVNRVNM